MGRYWLIGGAAALAVLLIVAIALALFLRPASLPEGTPERAVQSFLTALQDEEYGDAYALLTADLKDSCNLGMFESASRRNVEDLRDSRVTFDETNVDLENASAVVTAQIAQVRGVDLFGVDDSSFTRDFTLRQVGGEWLLSELAWPHYGCSRVPPPRSVVGTDLLDRAEADTPAPGSAEGALRQFLLAVRDGEDDVSHSFLSPALRSDCTVDRWETDRLLLATDSVSIETRAGLGDVVALTARVSRAQEDDASGDTETVFRETFRLTSLGGRWVFTVWPWPYAGCGVAADR